MRHGVAGRKLSRSSDHRMALLRNQVTDLLKYGKINTTSPKAKEVQPLAEKMITMGKKGTIHARRQALAFITDQNVVSKLFSDIAPKYADRTGGYTRLVKLGPRLGDGAEMARLELVE